jgi:uncharacterized membrane protein
MIQRIQSIWLFLAALCNSTLLFLDFYKVSSTNAAGSVGLRATSHVSTMILAIVCMIMQLVAIFLFRDRKRQAAVGSVCAIATAGLMSNLFFAAHNLPATAGSTGSFGPGAATVLLSLVFNILAVIAIRKDEKLVRSVDRLR